MYKKMQRHIVYFIVIQAVIVKSLFREVGLVFHVLGLYILFLMSRNNFNKKIKNDKINFILF